MAIFVKNAKYFNIYYEKKLYLVLFDLDKLRLKSLICIFLKQFILLKKHENKLLTFLFIEVCRFISFN